MNKYPRVSKCQEYDHGNGVHFIIDVTPRAQLRSVRKYKDMKSALSAAHKLVKKMRGKNND